MIMRNEEARTLQCALILIGGLSLAGLAELARNARTLKRNRLARPLAASRLIFIRYRTKGNGSFDHQFGPRWSREGPRPAGKLRDIVLATTRSMAMRRERLILARRSGRYGNASLAANSQLMERPTRFREQRGEHASRRNRGIQQEGVKAREIAGKGGESLEMTYLSADGEEGFREIFPRR